MASTGISLPLLEAAPILRLSAAKIIKRTDSGPCSTSAESASSTEFLLQVALDARLRDDGNGSTNTAVFRPESKMGPYHRV